MATRLYLRSNSPSVSPTSGDKSAALPVGTFNNLSGGVNEGTLEASAGVGSFTSTVGNSLAQTTHQDAYLARWSSATLAAQTISAANWVFAAGFTEGNANANAFLALSVYVWRPGTSAVVGYLYDSDAALGVEWATASTGQVITIAGGSVTTQAGDLLVIEAWCHAATQAMATAYSLAMGYDGPNAVANGVAVSNPASYLEYSGTLTFGAAPLAPRPMTRLQAVSRASGF